MLCTSQKQVVFAVVEPSLTAGKKLEDLMKTKYSSVEFRRFCMTWKDFQDKEWKKQDGSQYNLIHFIHSVYHICSSVEKLRERLQKCYAEMLNAGGALVICADGGTGRTCFLCKVDDSFWWKFKFNIVHEIASKEGWKVDADELKFEVDLIKCFNEESGKGNLLLDSLLLLRILSELP